MFSLYECFMSVKWKLIFSDMWQLIDKSYVYKLFDSTDWLLSNVLLSRNIINFPFHLLIIFRFCNDIEPTSSYYNLDLYDSFDIFDLCNSFISFGLELLECFWHVTVFRPIQNRAIYKNYKYNK